MNLEIVINDISYYMELHGSASGDGCSCLIDTLRQKLPRVICSVSRVPAVLEERHRNKRTRIAPGAYLPLDLWDEVVDLLGCYKEIQAVRGGWASRFKVVCVDLTWIGNAEVFPSWYECRRSCDFGDRACEREALRATFPLARAP